jgi:predicted lipoprotein with Yx(FWY)xxD motif
MLTEVEGKIVYTLERDGDGKGPCDDARPRKKEKWQNGS